MPGVLTQGRALALVVAGLALLLGAWAVANAPFTSPDEGGHFTRSASMARGQLLGNPAGPAPLVPGRAGVRLRFGQASTRLVRIPRSIDPAGLGCDALAPDRPADCAQTDHGPGDVEVPSAVATYDPLPSLAPGLATLLVHGNAVASLRAARLAGAALALVLLALALTLAAGPWTRLAICLALTPGTLFVIASVNPNSLEIAGAVALGAALFRLALRGEAGPLGYAALAGGGVAMVGSRPTSIGWLAVAIAAAFGCAPRAGATLRRHPALRLVGALWALAVAVSLVWEKAVEPSPPHGLSGASIRAAVRFLPEMGREYLGVFGPLDTRPPPWLGIPFALALLALAIVAFARLERRARLALAGIGLAILVIPAGVNATVLWFTGFALQARHVTALIVLAPVLAGVALDARGIAIALRWRVALAAAWAISQVAYLGFDVHRHVVGVSGPWWIPGREPSWLPGPIWLWMAAATAGALLTAAGASYDCAR